MKIGNKKLYYPGNNQSITTFEKHNKRKHKKAIKLGLMFGLHATLTITYNYEDNPLTTEINY